MTPPRGPGFDQIRRWGNGPPIYEARKFRCGPYVRESKGRRRVCCHAGRGRSSDCSRKVDGILRQPPELLADQLLEVTQLLLNNASHLFDPAFRLKIRIVSQLAFSLFSRSFCVVKIAFNFLPCAVCHFSSEYGLSAMGGPSLVVLIVAFSL